MVQAFVETRERMNPRNNHIKTNVGEQYCAGGSWFGRTFTQGLEEKVLPL